jgi:pilus assembly protein CpaB
MRALTIRVGESSAFGGLLRPGDRCDVLLTALRPGSTEQVTVPLLQNVLVLSVGEDTGGPDANDERQRRQGRDVNVAVTIEQAGLLTLAGEQGTLRLVLRNPEDVTILEGLPDTTATDLIEAEARVHIQTHRPPPPTMIENIGMH